MAQHWTCPFCDRDTVLNESYSKVVETTYMTKSNSDGPRMALTSFTVCPNPQCEKLTFTVSLWEMVAKPAPPGRSASHEPSRVLRVWTLIPSSNAKAFGDFVPRGIREDYEEACAIREQSPKSAATLARRALQGMIRDFWHVKENRLVDEIESLRGKVDIEVWDAMDAVRKVGNIGAHMGKDVNLIIDVEPEEAGALIGLIEMLVEEWYVHREQRKAALATVKAIAQNKDAAKKGPLPPPTSSGGGAGMP